MISNVSSARARGSGAPRARPSTAIMSARSLRRILGTEAGHCKSVPRAKCRPRRRTSPQASRMRSTSASSPGTISAVPMRDAAIGDRRLAPASRRCRRRAGRFRQTPAGRRGAGASGRRTRPAASSRPSRRGRTPRSRTAAASASSARSMSMRARERAPGRTGWSPAAARRRCAPAPTFSATSSCGGRRRASDRPSRPPPSSASAARPRLP